MFLPQTKESYHNQTFRILKSLRGKYFETVAYIALCGHFLTLSMRCREGKGEGRWAWWLSWWPSETLRVGGWIEEPEVAGAEQWGDATRTRVFSSPGYSARLAGLLHIMCKIEKEVFWVPEQFRFEFWDDGGGCWGLGGGRAWQSGCGTHWTCSTSLYSHTGGHLHISGGILNLFQKKNPWSGFA